MNTIKTKIIIADDHQLVIDGIKSMLADQDDIEIIATACDGAALVQAIKKEQPDLVLLDINMPKMDGVKATKKINQQFDAIKILILSTYDDVRLVKEILKLGASGYLLKTAPREELIKAIQSLMQGGNYFSQEISDKIFKSLMKTDSSPEIPLDQLPPVSLTPREREVIRLIAMEYTGKEIAKELFISQNTVETHRKNLLRKLKVRNTVGLVKYAMKHDLI